MFTMFLKGADTWFLHEGDHQFRAPDNLPSASIKPELIRDRLMKEVKLSRMWGPFDTPPFKHLMCFPVGLVPIKDRDEMIMIMHLSFPYGESINDFIDEKQKCPHHTNSAID